MPDIPPGMHLCDPAIAGGYLLPIDKPCPSDSTTTTVATTKFCLGYGQAFPVDAVCPRPPDNICERTNPKPIECTDTSKPAPVADQPWTSTTTTPAAEIPAADEQPVSSTIDIDTTMVTRPIHHTVSTLPATGSSVNVGLGAAVIFCALGAVLITLTRRRSRHESTTPA